MNWWECQEANRTCEFDQAAQCWWGMRCRRFLFSLCAQSYHDAGHYQTFGRHVVARFPMAMNSCQIKWLNKNQRVKHLHWFGETSTILTHVQFTGFSVAVMNYSSFLQLSWWFRAAWVVIYYIGSPLLKGLSWFAAVFEFNVMMIGDLLCWFCNRMVIFNASEPSSRLTHDCDILVVQFSEHLFWAYCDQLHVTKCMVLQSPELPMPIVPEPRNRWISRFSNTSLPMIEINHDTRIIY